MTLSDDAIERLVAELGHELRNPLAALQLATQDLADCRDCEDASKRVIERQVGRLCDVVEQLIAGVAKAADFDTGTLDARVLTSAILPRPPVSSPATPLPQTSMNVIIIDDNEDAAAMLALVLQGRGATCTVLHDGEQGVEAMSEQRFDLAIVDIGLPGIDGFEVAEQVGGLATKPGRIVALSGYGQARVRDRARNAGFDAYYVKPLSTEALATLLKPPLLKPPLLKP